MCHCEEAAGRRGNLAGSGWITGQLRRIRKLVREIATGAKRPRNDNSEVHTILTMACTDRQHCAGPGCPLPYNGVYGRREYPEICSCHRRSVSAATDAIGWCVFIGTLYELEVPSRDCHVGLRPPRNDNSGAGAVLAAAGTGCECSAGRGMPLPYNAYTKTPNGRGLRPGHGFYTRREEGWKTCGGILLTFRASA